jgi:hypothetical protein
MDLVVTSAAPAGTSPISPERKEGIANEKGAIPVDGSRFGILLFGSFGCFFEHSCFVNTRVVYANHSIADGCLFVGGVRVGEDRPKIIIMENGKPIIKIFSSACHGRRISHLVSPFSLTLSRMSHLIDSSD